ncbi:MAG: S24 family peptidase [Saccharospirillum sp.]
MSVQLLGRLSNGYQLTLPLFLEGQSANDAQDDLKQINLAQLCVDHPKRTLAVIQQSEAMMEAGIKPGDTLIVDQGAQATTGDLVLVNLQGDLMVRRLELQPTPRLMSAHRDYDTLVIPEDEALEIIGRVSHCIHTFGN